jgi:hypothetical protein
MGEMIRLRRVVDRDLIEEGGGGSLNSSNVSVRFYEAVDDEGTRLRYSSDLRALLFVSGDSLYIRFGDCMLEVRIEDIKRILRMR